MTAIEKSYYCGASTTQIIYETIGGFFDRVAEKHPDSQALILRHQGVEWTYAELQHRVDKLAVWLTCSGYCSRGPGRYLGPQQCRVGVDPACHCQDRCDYGVYKPRIPTL